LLFHSPSSHTARFPLFLVDPPSTAIYTLSLHDALPISAGTAAELAQIASHRGVLIAPGSLMSPTGRFGEFIRLPFDHEPAGGRRSEEHTSELQSLTNIVCRLLLEKKNHHAHSQLIPYDC